MSIKEGARKIFLKAKNVIVAPDYFFRSLKEKGIKDALKYAVILAIFTMLMNLIFYNPTLSDLLGILFLFPLFLTFVLGAVIHFGIKILGGKSEYSDAYQVGTYSMTPYFLLGWIQPIGTISFTILTVLMVGYNLWLLSLGLQQVYRLRRNKSMMAIIMALILLVLVVIIIRFLTAFLLA